MLTLIVAFILAAGATPCATEDSSACYWDASMRGNGAGHSFIALSDHVIIYLGN